MVVQPTSRRGRKLIRIRVYTLKKVTAAGKVAKSAHPGESSICILSYIRKQ